MSCHNFKGLKDWEINQLRKHIQDNQYFLGEKFHHAINYDDAESDFIQSYFETVCKDMRIEYCSNLCPLKDTCELGKALVANAKNK